jgi:gamma-glutamyltranspeptidase/glutathione hydrolase
LSLVEQFDIRSLGCNTAESIHLMVEAKKLAFADREAFVADPDFIDVPIQGLVSREYARERAKLIDPGRAGAPAAGQPWTHQPVGALAGRPEEDTTCFAVVDRWGNAVCQLQSIQSAWGSRLIAGNTGILLNNRMTYWHLEPGHVDCLAPGKRVRHTMNPVMAFNGAGSSGPDTPGQLVLVCGTPGADTQVQTNLQVISHLVDFGMTVAEAVESPRWRNTQNPTESNYPHVCDDLLYLESRFSSDVQDGLASRGHNINVIGPWEATGSEVMIQVDPKEGALSGAADPRRDGYAIGW